MIILTQINIDYKSKMVVLKVRKQIEEEVDLVIVRHALAIIYGISSTQILFTYYPVEFPISDYLRLQRHKAAIAERINKIK